MAKKQTTKKSDKPANKREPKPADRSAAITASWKNKDVAPARATKNKVKVDGTEYNSVGDAFRQLKLPMGKHIAFRMELKAQASGRKTFEDDKGKKYNFTLVK